MRRTNAEGPDTFTAKLGFFDRTFAPHTDRLGVSCRVQANARFQSRTVSKRALAILSESRICALGGPATAIVHFSHVEGGAAH